MKSCIGKEHSRTYVCCGKINNRKPISYKKKSFWRIVLKGCLHACLLPLPSLWLKCNCGKTRYFRCKMLSLHRCLLSCAWCLTTTWGELRQKFWRTFSCSPSCIYYDPSGVSCFLCLPSSSWPSVFPLLGWAGATFKLAVMRFFLLWVRDLCNWCHPKYLQPL